MPPQTRRRSTQYQLNEYPAARHARCPARRAPSQPYASLCIGVATTTREGLAAYRAYTFLCPRVPSALHAGEPVAVLLLPTFRLLLVSGGQTARGDARWRRRRHAYVFWRRRRTDATANGLKASTSSLYKQYMGMGGGRKRKDRHS